MDVAEEERERAQAASRERRFFSLAALFGDGEQGARRVFTPLLSLQETEAQAPSSHGGDVGVDNCVEEELQDIRMEIVDIQEALKVHDLWAKDCLEIRKDVVSIQCTIQEHESLIASVLGTLKSLKFSIVQETADLRQEIMDLIQNLYSDLRAECERIPEKQLALCQQLHADKIKSRMELEELGRELDSSHKLVGGSSGAEQKVKELEAELDLLRLQSDQEVRASDLARLRQSDVLGEPFSSHLSSCRSSEPTKNDTDSLAARAPTTEEVVSTQGLRAERSDPKAFYFASLVESSGDMGGPENETFISPHFGD